LHKKHFVVIFGGLKAAICRRMPPFTGTHHLADFAAGHESTKPWQTCNGSLHATLLLAFGVEGSRRAASLFRDAVLQPIHRLGDQRL